LEISRGRGFLKAKTVKRKYEPKLEIFPGGWGLQLKKKNICGRGINIFWNNHRHMGTFRLWGGSDLLA